MNCKDASALVGAYSDGQMERRQADSIRRHLATCSGCSNEHDATRALSATIQASVARYQAPPALRARVLAAIEAAPQSTPVRRRSLNWRAFIDRWPWLGGGALAGCAATMLAWSVGTAMIEARLNEDIAVVAVTSHVKATLDNELIQVASSNQHTVKPWLSARLDYSPPVPDLTDQGFTLVGGRLDRLEGKPVATLVYRIRQHTIDVFVQPETARSRPTAMRTVRGFNVAHASGSGMEWLAVSDVSPEVLDTFVEQFTRVSSVP